MIEKSVVYKGQEKTDSLDSKLRIEQGNGQMIVNDGVTNRVLISPSAMKVSQEGFEVLDADGDELIFSTDFNLFKIVATGKIDIESATGSSNTVIVNHNQSKQPLVIAFANNIGISGGGGYIAGNTQLPWYDLILSGGAFVIDAAITFTVSNTDIVFSLINRYGATIGTTIRYYIIQETSGTV